MTDKKKKDRCKAAGAAKKSGVGSGVGESEEASEGGGEEGGQKGVVG